MTEFVMYECVKKCSIGLACRHPSLRGKPPSNFCYPLQNEEAVWRETDEVVDL